MNIADIIASFLGFGLLHLRGHLGYAGWRWLFLIEVYKTIPTVSAYVCHIYLVNFIAGPDHHGLWAVCLCPHAPGPNANSELE